jgi:hypothetical protein
MSGVHKYRAVEDVSGTVITYEDWTAGLLIPLFLQIAMNSSQLK